MDLRRPQASRLGLIVCACLICLWVGCGDATASVGAGSLKLLISVEQQRIVAPFPARITLHFHNAGEISLWLYRHVRARVKAGGEETTSEQERQGAAFTFGGSTLAVEIQPYKAQNDAARQNAANIVAARGRVLESVGMPHPKLVRLLPGDDEEEKAVVEIEPALTPRDDRQTPLWGQYRLSVVYRAAFSNAAEIAKNLGLALWQGEASSNAIDIDLEPPPATAQGSVSGAVATAERRPIADALVSLSDEQEHLVSQITTDRDGRFAFNGLPFGLYWVTARRADSTVDTATFQHFELSASAPAGAVELILLPAEVYEPKQMLHKPVLFRVIGSAAQPVAGVTLEVVWSSGTVMDEVKGTTSEDGTAVLNLLPGRNFVTLKRRGCPKHDERVDVAGGEGIDDFRLTLECGPK